VAYDGLPANGCFTAINQHQGQIEASASWEGLIVCDAWLLVVRWCCILSINNRAPTLSTYHDWCVVVASRHTMTGVLLWCIHTISI